VVIRLDSRIDPTPGRQLAAVLSVDEAVQAVEIAAMDLAARRAMREPHPRSGPQPRCSACCKFKSNAKAPCPCGFVPGQGYAA
jgi:hypothetical protein